MDGIQLRKQAAIYVYIHTHILYMYIYMYIYLYSMYTGSMLYVSGQAKLDTKQPAALVEGGGWGNIKA